MITTQKELRKAFWEAHPKLKRQGNKKQNDYPTDTRVRWCGFVEHNRQIGIISTQLAERATL